MADALTRKEAREAVFCLLYESEFHNEETPAQIMELAQTGREAVVDAYVASVYPGIMENIGLLDALIGHFSNGWKTGRMSRVSRAALRLCTYEMLFRKDIPAVVSLNEAVEISKTYDDPKARAFINGILNSIKTEIDTQGKENVITAYTPKETQDETKKAEEAEGGAEPSES